MPVFKNSAVCSALDVSIPEKLTFSLMPWVTHELPTREIPRYPTAIHGFLADPGGFTPSAATLFPHQIHAKIPDYEQGLRRKNSWGDLGP